MRDRIVGFVCVLVIAAVAVGNIARAIRAEDGQRTSYARGYAAAVDSVRARRWSAGVECCLLYDAAGVPYYIVAIPSPGDTVMIWPQRLSR